MKKKNINNRVEIWSGNIQSKLKQPRFLLKLTALAGIAFIASLFLKDTSSISTNLSHTEEGVGVPKLGAFPVVAPRVEYGFALDTFHVIEDKIQSDDVFTVMLTKRGLTYRQADSLAKVAKPFYDFTKIQDGKPFIVLSRDPRTGYDYFIYEPDAKRYVIVDLKNVSIKEVKYEVTSREFEIAGEVKNSLWESMVEQGLSYALADMVEDALKYKFDLRKFHDGDTYKLIWEEEFVDNVSVGVKSLKAAYIKERDEEKPVYAIYFDNGSERGWYEKNGLPMRDGFLKSPLKYSRITSYYSRSRLHPILGYHRPHFGTDYAAPHGTPILSVADGTVTEARYGGGNGNYVKIRHVRPYESQYLHMSRFAKGVHAGTRVRQGQVIGYVGSTGLATGPHVCFRFWKNGSQVNHLREKLPQVSTFSSADRVKFKTLSDTMIARLDNIPILSPEENQARRKEFMGMYGKP
jgi:murein DD-endopeptidase MepM/ murein hydrolase activator NlpD